jgi:hypothetical protein
MLVSGTVWQIKKRFDIKTGDSEVGFYLGNRIVLESMDQSEYIQQILKNEMVDSHPVATPMVSRPSSSDKGDKLSH